MPKHINNKEQQPNTPPAIATRSFALRLDAGGAPVTLDLKTRSVQCVAASETPVLELDWERYERVDTVLLMSGCQLPENGQLPLLDSHSRYSTSAVVGSARDLRVEGEQLIARAVFTSLPEGDEPFTKVKEGHLTDFSIGRRDLEAVFIAENETSTIEGRTFAGPARIVTKWIPKELSICPIGADDTAKTRTSDEQTPVAHQPADGQPVATKEPNMNEKLRAFLETRGLAKDASEDTAWEHLQTLDVRSEIPADPATPATTPTTVIDSDASVVAAVRSEQLRIMEIQDTCRHYGYDDLAADLIKEGKTLDQARSAILAKNMESAQPTTTIGHRVEVTADATDKFRAAAEDAMLVRGGFSVEKPADGHDELTGFSLRELARESLRVSGRATGGNPMEMVGRALTTSDFPILLSNVANKSLMDGYNGAEETWRKLFGVGSVSDFKTNTIARAGEMDDLDEIGEDGEYKYGSRSEGKEQFKIATYGKLFSLSRQTIINDDLGALTDIPRAHGEAWSRKVGDIAYAVVIANAAMGDGVALFHANHANIGTGGALGETTMAQLIELMKLQKDVGGKRRLNIQPRYLLAPVALEGSAEVFFGSNQFAVTDTGATRSNPYAGTKYERIYEPRLDDDSSTAYYLLGDKNKTIKVYFLNGQQAPYLETRQGWTVDGVEYKVRGDAGAKALDWKAITKNAGA